MRRPVIGLALGSGLARGWAHIGVIRALEEAGIAPDIVCGTSIGAVVGGCYLGGKLDMLEAWSLGITRRRMLRYLDISLGGGSLIAGKRLSQILKENLGDTSFADLKGPFVAVAVELHSGHEVWLREGSVIRAIEASYALPGLFPPVLENGRWLADGALVNPLPVSVCRALGAQLVIAVNLNADLYGAANARGSVRLVTRRRRLMVDGVSEPLPFDENGGPKGLKAALLFKEVFEKRRGRPSLFETMVGALNIVQDRLTRSRIAGDPPDVLIAPHLGHMGILDFHRAEDAITHGREAVDAARPSLDEALEVLSLEA